MEPVRRNKGRLLAPRDRTLPNVVTENNNRMARISR